MFCRTHGIVLLNPTALRVWPQGNKSSQISLFVGKKSSSDPTSTKSELTNFGHHVPTI